MKYEKSTTILNRIGDESLLKLILRTNINGSDRVAADKFVLEPTINYIHIVVQVFIVTTKSTLQLEIRIQVKDVLG
jgi:hypothetical protein